MTEAEIKAVVEALDQEECEILLRYIYRFMGKNVGLNVTLKFHAALSDKAGTAGILRVLTDRKTV